MSFQMGLSRRSLRARLLGLAAVAIGIGLAIVWFALLAVFERHLERRAEAELASEIIRIAARLDAGGEQLALAAGFDPRFERPFGGRYWQVEPDGGETLRSRSLWDERLPPPAAGDGAKAYEAAGPRGSRLLLRAETLTFPGPGGDRRVRVIAASDRAEIDAAVASYGRDLAVALAIAGFSLALGAALQVRLGLSPLASLREGLAEVRAGRRRRLNADVPSEVRPLVEEVNELLAAQDAALSKARAQADDLAHGLKTPLTVLSAVSHNLHRHGHGAEASEIVGQVEMMRRRIDRQLARARLAAEAPAASRPADLVDKLIGVMQRTPRGRALAFVHEERHGGSVAADDMDVAEAIGNVIDNASKWARANVRATTRRLGGRIVVVVEDDGPGVPENRLGSILARGTRLDEEREGSGLGLAIAREIVAAYGGDIALARSPLGGLAVTIGWPAAEGTESPQLA
jgi:signal transduction histidine kinase